MPRIARIVLEDVPYHITQRGNGRQQVFFDDYDYQLYLDLLRQHSEKAALTLIGYCLMPNHIHVIAIPKRARAMACALGRTHADFARHYNLKKRACGHTWQARFFSTPLDQTHLWQALAYVERNPVRAEIVLHAGRYAWSSARQHLGLSSVNSMVELTCWQAEYDEVRWQQVLETTIDEEAFGQRLQEASRRGRPLGDADFIQRLEKRLGRRLRPFAAGRPKKPAQSEHDQLTLGIAV